MGLLDKKYQFLLPDENYLTDKVVLAQAWKKAHQYIRSTNWYADTFELDRSAIDLDAKLNKWIYELKDEKFSFEPLRLVPAPKTERWHFKKIVPPESFSLDGLLEATGDQDFSHAWRPDIDKQEASKSLRPLAHVTIRDQSLMTALMMCLANKVETLQCDTSTELKKVHTKKLVNYGNRLYCTFNDDEANFSWGNSTTYSKYFSDYQRFLERPMYFGGEALQKKVKDQQVFEVHLDLEKFYDRIDRLKLTKKIHTLCDEKKDAIVTRLLTCFEHWVWDDESPTIYDHVCSQNNSIIPSGIPQGLVAGGFLSNIYLLDFDHYIGELIGSDLNEGIHLVDYCRYVDDMRLIIVVDESIKVKSVEDSIHEKLGNKLQDIGLKFNQEKTRVETFRSKNSGISTKLHDIQSKVSGPLSINEIDEQLGSLEGLIGLADSLRSNESDKDNTNPLALIDGLNNDVREDTLLRFTANKIHTLLKQKRSLVAQEVGEDGKLKAGSWDYLQERMARKFIACWSKDPSLVLMLKKGLELFPDKRILKPVLEQLRIVIERKEYPKQQKIAGYCLGEIFRHAAIAIHIKDHWAFPAHANVEGFFESLQIHAVDIIENEDDKDKNILEQARFFCLVRNDSCLGKDTNSESFNTITKMMKGFRSISPDMKVADFVANALLAYQLAENKTLVVRAVNCMLEKAEKNSHITKHKKLNYLNAQTFCKKVAAESPMFFVALFNAAKNNDLSWPKSFKELITQTGIMYPPISGNLKRFNGSEWISLLGVIKRTDNPFAHENAALALLMAIFNGGKFGVKKDAIADDVIEFEKIIDIANCKVSCKDWSKIQSLDVEVEILQPGNDEEAIFPVPEWVSDSHKSLYRIGIFLRSCLLGSIDWSGMNVRMANQAKYTGLKTSFMKRQLGMMHSPEAINGETAPMSGWVSSLLFHLLQWPGASIHDGGYDWPIVWDMKALKKLVEERIKYQKSLFCKMSGIPAYVEKVNLDWPKEKQDLRVVMVQSLLPLKGDFADHGLMLDTSIYRARHRRHVAAVAELILHKSYSHSSIDDTNYKRTDIDLIIWPELAVNNDDMDILKCLADKTGAVIFTGLTFTTLPGVDGPNNIAKWIIPKKQASGRQFINRLQGKWNMMQDEVGKIKPWRPYQLLIELVHPAFPKEKGFMLTGTICYDATDIKMTADLKNKSNAYLIVALNKDVNTFDSMVDALYYHMYQHVVLVNTGEFGGSVAKAPYKESYDKLITHVHGANQVSISSFEMNMFDFRNLGKSYKSGKKLKTKPAG
jgi:Reverse transcriptase (RNA-dependent DNA polymerase)